MYPYIQFFGHNIGTYGLISVLASIICGVLLIIGLKKANIMMEDGILFLIFVLFGVVLGSHLLYGITQYRLIPYLFEKVSFPLWLARAQYIFGGSVFYGGLLGGIGSGYLGLKILKQDVNVYADLMAPIIPLFHGFARIGCFFAGCCYGVPCEWGFKAEYNSLVPELSECSRFPVQLLESACNFVLAFMLYILLRKSKQNSFLRGNLIPIYLLMYGFVRFFDEFLRGDEIRGIWGVFSTSQLISIVTITASIFLLALKKIKQLNNFELHSTN